MIKLHLVSADLLIALVVGEVRTPRCSTESVHDAGRDRVSSPLGGTAGRLSTWCSAEAVREGLDHVP